MENSTDSPKKPPLKTELPYDPAVLFQGTYPKQMKTGPQKHVCTHMFIAALLRTAQGL